jgi:hypothetical protein
LYNIIIEFGESLKLVRLIKVCLNETCSEVRIGKYLSNTFPIQDSLKQGDTLKPSFLNFALESAIRMVQGKPVGLKLKGTHQLLIYVNDVNLLGDNINSIKKTI